MPYKNIEDRRACSRRNAVKYREKNREKLAEKFRRYYQSNKEELVEKRRKRRKENPEKYTEQKQKETRRLKERKREINRKLVDYFGGECRVCGIKDDPCIFDFHHQNPNDKYMNMAALITLTRDWDVLVAEAKRCVLLCSNCHRKFHRGLFCLLLELDMISPTPRGRQITQIGSDFLEGTRKIRKKG